MNKPNPEMLILARESRGMTQTDLGNACGISQANISKFESGALEITDDHLARLSRALSYPLEFFHQHEVVYGYGSTCIYHRKRQTLPIGEYRKLLAQINVTRIQVARLLRGVEIQAENRFARLDIQEHGSPEHAARLVRGMWQLPPGPVQNLIGLIEAVGGLVIRCSFGTRKLDAFSQWHPGMPPLFFVNSDTPTDRCRFTLAHELGHVIMHMTPTTNLEREADAFAAEFLMPRRDIGGDLSPLSLARLAALKPYWKVSMAALARRAKDLKKISDTQYKSIYTQMSRLGWRLNEPNPLEAEVPGVLRAVLDVHRNQHGYTVDALSRVALSTVDEFLARYLPEQKRLRAV